MAAFIAAGYKAPLTAVVFVAETTGGHSYIIPSLIGAAVAYASRARRRSPAISISTRLPNSQNYPV